MSEKQRPTDFNISLSAQAFDELEEKLPAVTRWRKKTDRSNLNLWFPGGHKVTVYREDERGEEQ